MLGNVAARERILRSPAARRAQHFDDALVTEGRHQQIGALDPSDAEDALFAAISQHAIKAHLPLWGDIDSAVASLADELEYLLSTAAK